jgi:hypothetical protein
MRNASAISNNSSMRANTTHNRVFRRQISPILDSAVKWLQDRIEPR